MMEAGKSRLPVRKIFGFLGMEAVLLCVSFFMPAFAEKLPSEERKLQVEETLSGEETSPAEKKREEKETLTYESPIFTGGGEEFLPEETRTEGEKEYRAGINANPKRKENRRNDVCPGDNPI